MKQSSIFGHVNFSKPGQKSNDFKFDFDVPHLGDKEASTAESTKKKVKDSKTIILVPKKVISKKRNISQLKGLKAGPAAKKRKELAAPKEAPKKAPKLEIMSDATLTLVAKLMKPKV
jgi:hypothetical protein